MQFQRVLVVCVGNICRSPVGEALLRRHAPGLTVASAGIGALVGHGADEDAAAVAGEHDLSLEGHVARQFTPDLAAGYDLILVMEPGHRREIVRVAPHLSGKTMLFDAWTGQRGIPDPYRKSRAFHETVYREIEVAAEAWAAKLRR